MMNDRLLHKDLEFKHKVDIQSRFSDYDTFGHINNNAYMAYFDLGKTAFFNDLTGRSMSPVRVGAVIVNVNVDFLSPAIIGEPLAVLTAVVAVGERSFTLYQRVVNACDGRVKAQSTTILAGFDTATQSSAPLRPEIFALLSDRL